MSHHDYRTSIYLSGQDHPFYALIMAAMRKADSDNLEKLKTAFPHTYEELRARYNAPGGYLEEDETESVFVVQESFDDEEDEE